MTIFFKENNCTKLKKDKTENIKGQIYTTKQTSDFE